jgi:hypothetical protein
MAAQREEAPGWRTARLPSRAVIDGWKRDRQAYDWLLGFLARQASPGQTWVRPADSWSHYLSRKRVKAEARRPVPYSMLSDLGFVPVKDPSPPHRTVGVHADQMHARALACHLVFRRGTKELEYEIALAEAAEDALMQERIAKEADYHVATHLRDVDAGLRSTAASVGAALEALRRARFATEESAAAGHLTSALGAVAGAGTHLNAAFRGLDTIPGSVADHGRAVPDADLGEKMDELRAASEAEELMREQSTKPGMYAAIYAHTLYSRCPDYEKGMQKAAAEAATSAKKTEARFRTCSACAAPAGSRCVACLAPYCSDRCYRKDSALHINARCSDRLAGR